MSSASWIRKSLASRGIPFEELRHPTHYAAEEVARREHVSGLRVAQAVPALADGRPVELVLPASRRVDLERVKAALAAKEVHLASEEEMAKAFSGREGVAVLMDRVLDADGDLIFQAGAPTEAIRLPFPDWFVMVVPEVVAISQPSAIAP
jgi:Ala-tRNA(Pro) deacylase